VPDERLVRRALKLAVREAPAEPPAPPGDAGHLGSGEHHGSIMEVRGVR